MSTYRAPSPLFPRPLRAGGPVALLASLLLTAPAVAQCSAQWLPSGGAPGVGGQVNVMTMWDRDGAGPLPPVLVVGGNFTFAGNTLVNNIAVYDPATGIWSPLGPGFAGGGSGAYVFALTTLPNGDLVAGGLFTNSGGVPMSNIARWNGTNWSALGSGMDFQIYAGVFALVTMPNGDVVAGGAFTTAGGVYAPGIARWNGSWWSAIGPTAGAPPGVSALAVLPNGHLVAGGTFTEIGGVFANCVARWNGVAWAALGSGVNGSGSVMSLKTLANGDLIVGGYFNTVGGVSANHVARWNGTSWSALGTGLGGPWAGCKAITQLPNGNLVVVGGFFTAGGVAASYIARWNGTTWSPLVSGFNDLAVAVTTLGNGDVVAGGWFQVAGGVSTSSIARWNGTSWSALSAGTATTGQVTTMAVGPSGEVIVGGHFQIAGGIYADRIVRWDGTGWTNIGNMNSFVEHVAVRPNGEVIATGRYMTFAGYGVPVTGIARRSSSGVWSSMGAWPQGAASEIRSLATCANGDVIAAGSFTSIGGGPATNIARWNGASWAPLGSGVNNSVSAVTALANGDIVVGGDFTIAGSTAASRVARWDGVAWSALGSGVDNLVSALVAMPNGDLVASGSFTTAGGVSANRIARWDGASWSALGTGMNGGVAALAVLPDGDLAAAGTFTIAGGVAANRIARWNGTTWSALGSGVDAGVVALAATTNGLFAGGSFLTAGGQFAPNLARFATNCPATVTPAGIGCNGSGGASTYAALNGPWVGATFRGRGTNLPANALGIVVSGFAPTSLPLASLVPPSPAPCALLVTPDLLEVTLVAGSVDTQLAIPDVPSLAGLTLHQQLVVLEVDGALQLVQSTSTNALSLTVGTL